MAYEVKTWKQDGCDLKLSVSDFYDREYNSQEINERFGEGGGLNANYNTFESGMRVASLLALRAGLEYGRHYVFKTAREGFIHLDFCNMDAMRSAMVALARNRKA